MKLWSIKSKTNPSCQDGLIDVFSAMERQHGKAKHWPVDAEIFFWRQGTKFWKHVGDMGWAQDHIPLWCVDVIEARAKQGEGNYKKCPQATSTFGPAQGQHQQKTQRTP